MTVFRHVRILPLLVLVSFLSFVVRFGEFAAGIRSGEAFAQEEVSAEAPPLPSAKAGGAEHSSGPPLPASPAASMPASSPPGAKAEGWTDAVDAAVEFSDAQAELFKDLSKRREELDQREKDLITREALLEAGQKELDQKIREMTAIRNEIQVLLQQQTEQEKARIDSLVKIYEGMKSKDAAVVFNTLDMDVLINILQNMSERKTAPIMAQMDPERVKKVTTILAQKNQIPAIPGE